MTGGADFRFENPVAVRFLLDMLLARIPWARIWAALWGLDWQVRDAEWLADDAMDTWQATLLGLKQSPRELTAFEIEAFFRFTPGERQVIEERRRPELTTLR